MINLSKLFKKWSRRSVKTNLNQISRHVDGLIDKLAKKIFYLHKDRLQVESLTYIVPAIWGIGPGGVLTDCQKQIYEEVLPVMADILLSFQPQKLANDQLFAIGSIVRSLITTKIAFMIETSRNNTPYESDSSNNYLANLKHVGTA